MPTKRGAQSERELVVEFIRGYLSRHDLARVQMAIMVIVTGLVGFLFSAVLLQLGVQYMAGRYALAVAGAYAVFILLVRLWVELHRRGIDLDESDLHLISDASDAALHSSEPRAAGKGPDSWDVDGGGARIVADSPDPGGGGGVAEVFDLDEAWVIVVPLVMLFGALVASVLLIWSAPALLSEVVVDVVLVSTLYRRLVHLERRSWLATALRKTWVPFAIVAVVLAICGILLQSAAPGASSLGEVLSEI